MKNINGIIYTEDGEVLYKCDPSKKGKVIVAPGVKGIYPEAFKGCEGVTSIILPDSLERIGKSAFEKTNITEIILPDHVSYLGESAFSECKFLEKVECPQCLGTLGSKAFWACISLTSIDLKNTCVHTIYGDTFAFCHSLTQVSLNTDISICDNAFQFCKNLETQVLISEKSKCSKKAFYNCKNVSVFKEIMLSKNDNTFQSSNPSIIIDDYMFENATGMVPMKLPIDVVSLGKGAFKNSDLESITISKGIEKIHEECFAKCNKLNSVSFEEGVKFIGRDSFKDCSSLEQIYLPSSIINIDADCFRNCKNLCDVSVGPNTTYDDSCFSGCHENLKIIRRTS